MLHIAGRKEFKQAFDRVTRISYHGESYILKYREIIKAISGNDETHSRMKKIKNVFVLDQVTLV
jgi:hypothetical protein